MDHLQKSWGDPKDSSRGLKPPRSKLRGIFPVRYPANQISLANPAASRGECARNLVQGNIRLFHLFVFLSFHDMLTVHVSDYPKLIESNTA